MTRPTSFRYPWDDLGQLIAVQTHDGEMLGTARKRIARYFSMDQRHLARLQERGLTRDMAIRLSEASGFLPYEVWPEILYDVDEPLTRICECCGNAWVPETTSAIRNGRFCHRRCRDKQARIRAKGLTPAVRCAAPGCPEMFVPRSTGKRSHKYCSKRCASRVYKAIERQKESVRERERVRKHRYYQETRAYTLRWQAAYKLRKRAERQAA